MKILSTADIHLGSHGCLSEDVSLDCFEWILNIAKEEKVDRLVISGDILKTNKSTTYIKDSLIKILVNFNETSDIKIDILLGNHDYIHKSGFNGESGSAYTNLDILTALVKSIPNVTVVSLPKVEIHLDERLSFLYLPFTSNYEYAERIIKNSVNDKLKNVLFCHTSVIGSKYDNLMTVAEGISTESFNGYDMCLFGHYHTRQNLSENGLYVGSPYQMTIAEKGKKGIYLLDTDEIDSVEFIENDISPRFINVLVRLTSDTIKYYINNKEVDRKKVINVSKGNVCNIIIESEKEVYFETFNRDVLNTIRSNAYCYSELLKLQDKNKLENNIEIDVTEFDFSKSFLEFLNSKNIDQDTRIALDKILSDVINI